MTSGKTLQTIESLKARTEEVGECWEWSGYYGNGSPYVAHGGKMQSVRKVVAMLTGKQIAKGFFGTSCDNPRCVNPDHVKLRNPKAHMANMAKKAGPSLQRRIKLQQYHRTSKRIIKLDVEKVREIRTSDKSHRELAEQFGVSKSLISHVRLNKLWVEFSGPFAGLMR